MASAVAVSLGFAPTSEARSPAVVLTTLGLEWELLRPRGLESGFRGLFSLGREQHC